MPVTKRTLHALDRAVNVWGRAQAGEELHPLEYAAACADILLSTLEVGRRTWRDDDTEPLRYTWSPEAIARGL